jgi:hypothetical protein
MDKNPALSIFCAFSITLASSQSFPQDVFRTNRAGDQLEARAQACMLSSTSADNSGSGKTGSLRSDGHSATEVLAKLQSTIQQECASFSAPDALRQVKISVGENHIVISGTVPSETDEERLLSIAQAYADGRTVFNKLSPEHSAEKQGPSAK